MPPSPSKTLSPAELAKLEHAFATDPGSEAYKPLAEAYLGMGRFMEAMVVCKKGVKAHPNLPDGRVLLARVYAEQGKDKKALEELAGALQVAPTDKLVLRMAGSLQLKNGEAEAGKQNLLKAWQADPNDADTKAALAQFKIEPPKAEEPEPATERVNIPSPSAGTQRVSGRAAAPIAGPGTRASGARPALEEPVRSKPNGAQARSSQAVRAPSAARKSSVRMPSYDEEEISDPSYRARQASKGKGAFIFLLVVVVLGAGAYFGIGRYRAIQTRNVNKALTDAGNQLKHDSFDSYKKACEAGERALDADSSSARAHAYLAYAWAIRWGEHGGGDEAKQQAEQHLAAAKKGDISDFPYLAAADALVKTYSGKSQEALQQLDDLSKHSDSALIFLTLGIIQMNVGDLEHARDNLTKAQQMASSDPRVYAALGTLNRRRGEDEAASRNYDFALRYEKDHAESVLGYSLLVLEQDNPRFEIASRVLKRLLDSDPPPSPRQLATAHLARAYLVSRVSNEIQQLAKAEDQKELSEKTGVPMDKAKAAQDVTKEEETGFSLDRGNPELHLIKGRRLASEKQLDGAIAEFNTAVKMDPTRANYYVELAQAYLNKDDPKSAAAALGDAIKRMGESPKLINLLAKINRKQGKLDDAIAQLKRALADPKVKNPEGWYLLGSIDLELSQKDSKKFPEAIDALAKSQADYIGQGWRLAQTDTELGRAYAGSGDRTKADDAFQKAIKADENFEPAYFFYGQFLVGDPKSREAGRKALQEYLRRDPKGSYAGEAQKLQ